MSESIGKFFAPNGTAILEVDNDNFKCSSSLNFPVGGINYLNTDNYHALVLSSGQAAPGNTTYKPEVILFPNSSSDSHYNNKVVLRVYDNCSSDGTTTTLKLGDSEYGVKINGNPIESIYSFGNNHIQYANGLLICYKDTVMSNTYETFPIPFIYTPTISFGYWTALENTHHIAHAKNLTNTGFTMVIYNLVANSINSGSDGSYIAIGRWK